MFEQDEEIIDNYLEETEDSVNFYELLGVAPDVDAKTIRRRVAEMFLEAQNNVEHRNFRRRFYFRELMESLLPKARHLLLDHKRRAAYNQFLGVAPPPAPPVTETVAAPTESLPIVSTSPFASPSPLASVAPPLSTREESDARVLNADRVLETMAQYLAASPIEEASTEEASTEEALAEQSAGVQSAFGDGETSSQTPVSVVSSGAITSVVASARRGVTPEHAKMDAERVLWRRDTKRRELIRQELVAEGKKWGFVAGASAFAIGGAVSLGLGFSLDAGFLKILALPVALASAAFCARYAHREARKRIIALLSQMPYDQLLQRCARG